MPSPPYATVRPPQAPHAGLSCPVDPEMALRLLLRIIQSSCLSCDSIGRGNAAGGALEVRKVRSGYAASAEVIEDAIWAN